MNLGGGYYYFCYYQLLFINYNQALLIEYVLFVFVYIKFQNRLSDIIYKGGSCIHLSVNE